MISPKLHDISGHHTCKIKTIRVDVEFPSIDPLPIPQLGDVFQALLLSHQAASHPNRSAQPCRRSNPSSNPLGPVHVRHFAWKRLGTRGSLMPHLTSSRMKGFNPE